MLNYFISCYDKSWQSLWIDIIWCNMYLVKYIRIWYCNNLLFSLVRCKPKYFDTQEVQAYYINSYFLRILIFFVLFIPVAWLSIFLSYPFSSFSLSWDKMTMLIEKQPIIFDKTCCVNPMHIFVQGCTVMQEKWYNNALNGQLLNASILYIMITWVLAIV